jgi:hypothetical protein
VHFHFPFVENVGDNSLLPRHYVQNYLLPISVHKLRWIAPQMQTGHKAKARSTQIVQQIQIAELPVENQGPITQKLFYTLKSSIMIQVARTALLSYGA